MASNVMLRLVGNKDELVCWSPLQPEAALEMLRNRLAGGDADPALQWAGAEIVISWDKVMTARVSAAADKNEPEVF